MTDDEKIVYALGLSMAQALGRFDLSPHELAIFKRALSDAAAKKPAIPLEQWGPKIQAFANERGKRVAERGKVEAEKEKASSVTFLEKAAAEPGAVKTDSGMIYKELQAGSGPSPKATDTVKVNYRGTLLNGTEFDSSYKRGEPAEFALNQVIPCWTEGLQKLQVGGKARLVCPANLAYGDRSTGEIPAGSTLIFEVELLGIGKSGQ